MKQKKNYHHHNYVDCYYRELLGQDHFTIILLYSLAAIKKKQQNKL